jgi:hypothetical protein
VRNGAWFSLDTETTAADAGNKVRCVIYLQEWDILSYTACTHKGCVVASHHKVSSASAAVDPQLCCFSSGKFDNWAGGWMFVVS